MYSASKTRTQTSTCTQSRVDAVLDVFCGDLAAFIARELISRDRAVDWLRDLSAVLVMEALERFQVKVTFPGGRVIGLDYEVADDGRIQSSDECGGFSLASFPEGVTLTLVVRWRTGAPRFEEARRFLRERGWGPASMLEAEGAPDRAYAEGGYGVYRRTIGEWL